MIVLDKRKRLYYTKGQITNGLDTFGKEYMFTDNTEYIGQYHTYTTNEIFSEASFVQGKSRKLIPYRNPNEVIEGDVEVGVNPQNSFDYDAIKSIDIPKSKLLNASADAVTDKDIQRGYTTRNFVYKVNDGNLIELNEDDYNKVGTEEGMAAELWKKFIIRWKVSGPDYDIVDSQGNIKESGIIDTNKRTVYVTSEEYPPLKQYITDFRNIISQ